MIGEIKTKTNTSGTRLILMTLRFGDDHPVAECCAEAHRAISSPRASSSA